MREHAKSAVSENVRQNRVRVPAFELASIRLRHYQTLARILVSARRAGRMPEAVSPIFRIYWLTCYWVNGQIIGDQLEECPK